MKACYRCTGNILQHNVQINCLLCNNNYHANCIGLAKNDVQNIDKTIWSCLVCNASLFPFNGLIEDEEFMGVINNSTLDIRDIDGMLFAPFEINDTDIHQLDQIDPDGNYFNEFDQIVNTECKYHTEDSFLKQNDINKAQFSMLHLNIRSMHKNINQFNINMQMFQHKFDIIGFSETWLKPHKIDEYEMQSYVSYHTCRELNARGGGVSLYINSQFIHEERKDLKMISPVIESVFIEIEKTSINTDKNCIVGVVYRPPNSNMQAFMESLIPMIKKITDEKKLLYIMGDYNINLLNSDSHKDTGDFINSMYSLSMFPLINKPTRITKYSATLIDNIFTNHLGENFQFLQGILYTDISDHMPIYHITTNRIMCSKDRYVIKRLVTEDRKTKFKHKINELDWADIIENTETNPAFNNFSETFLHFYSECFPLKKSKVCYTNKKTWLSSGLKVSIKCKNKMYKKMHRHPSEANEAQYKAYKNKLNHILRIAEKNHFHSLLELYQGNAKKTWSILKEVINRRKQSKMSAMFKVGNIITTDKQKIANCFNKYFVNAGDSLAKQIPHHPGSPLQYLRGNYINSLFLTPVTDDEIITIVKGLKNSSPGLDGLRTDIIKDVIRDIAKPITHICNLSFMEGVFPDSMKLAKVTPIYKKGDPKLFPNYRPISVLSIFSKILEKVMYTRLQEYIVRNNILYDLQFGFRESHSTFHALSFLCSKLQQAIDDGQYAIGVFLDFSKAFDTINHDILFQKLEHYGIRGITLKWFKSYLFNRRQAVSFQNVLSQEEFITCGVPQGSILGPLLFLLYINDLPNVSDTLLAILFADDTNVFVTGQNIKELEQSLNVELQKISSWLQVNRLSLNIAKTHYMIFNGKKKTKHNIDVKIQGETIAECIETTFLGITIDAKLTWRNHIEKVCNKMSKCTGIIARVKHILPKSALKTLYNTLVLPYLLYCNIVWGCTHQSKLDKLVTAQKRIIRIVDKTHYLEHTNDIFYNLGLLKVNDINVYITAIFMYNYEKKLVPTCFRGMFMKNEHVHQYKTRHAHQYRTAKHKTDIVKYSLKIQGPKIWKNLPSNIQMSPSLFTFKKLLKAYLISQYQQ